MHLPSLNSSLIGRKLKPYLSKFSKTWRTLVATMITNARFTKPACFCVSSISELKTENLSLRWAGIPGLFVNGVLNFLSAQHSQNRTSMSFHIYTKCGSRNCPWGKVHLYCFQQSHCRGIRTRSLFVAIVACGRQIHSLCPLQCLCFAHPCFQPLTPYNSCCYYLSLQFYLHHADAEVQRERSRLWY